MAFVKHGYRTLDDRWSFVVDGLRVEVLDRTTVEVTDDDGLHLATAPMNALPTNDEIAYVASGDATRLLGVSLARPDREEYERRHSRS